MKISKLTIEGFHNVANVTYDFDQINYLIGRNGAGKSTVLQAIQLALLGYIPGTPKNNKEALFRHANSKTMSVSLELSGEGGPITISRTWARSNSSINSTVYITPDGYDVKRLVDDIELPVFNFNEFIGMTANKLKDWFVDFLPSADVDVDWKKELEDALASKHISPKVKQSVVDDVVSQIQAPGSRFSTVQGVDQIRMVNEHIKNTLSFYKSELTRLESTIQSLVFYDDVESNMTEDEIECKMRELNQHKSEILAAEQKRSAFEQSKKLLDSYSDCTANSYELDPKYIKLSEEYNDLCNTLTDIEVEEEQLSGKLDHLKKKKDTLWNEMKEQEIALGKLSVILKCENVCPYTSQACDSIQNAKVSAQEEANQINVTLAKLNEELESVKSEIEDTTLKLNEQLLKVSSINTSKQSSTLVMSNIHSRYDARDKLKASMITDEDIPVCEGTVEEVDAELSILQDTLAKVKANAQYEAFMGQFTEAKFEREECIECYKTWEKLTGVNGLQSSSQATSSFTEFENKMNEYIPKLFENKYATFNVGTTANSFNFGVCEIDGKGGYIPFDLLSSGEKCLFTLVLLISIIECSNSSLHLLLVDDIFDHLDDDNVVKLFELLPKITDTQMIFAGVKIVNNDDVKTISIGD